MWLSCYSMDGFTSLPSMRSTMARGWVVPGHFSLSSFTMRCYSELPWVRPTFLMIKPPLGRLPILYKRARFPSLALSYKCSTLEANLPKGRTNIRPCTTSRGQDPYSFSSWRTTSRTSQLDNILADYYQLKMCSLSLSGISTSLISMLKDLRRPGQEKKAWIWGRFSWVISRPQKISTL